MNDLPADPIDLGETIRGLREGQLVFGRFILRRVIGRGGMSEVWQAHDRGLEREVALKFLPEIVAHDRTAVDDLKRETRRALTLTHPRIVRIYDFLCEGELAALSMELIDGDALSRLRLRRPDKILGVAELRPLLIQLCEALDYAHVKARVVHRDLKPANLMVAVAGGLKVTDFGISATIADSSTRVSRVVGVCGTPVYMSPQQLMGDKPAATDDIYSLGATLYELLTGKPPFHSGDVVAQAQGKVPVRIGARRAELGIGSDGQMGGAVPVEWEDTIAACLAKEPAARPQSAREVAVRMRLEVVSERRPGTGEEGRPVALAAPGIDRGAPQAGGAAGSADAAGRGLGDQRTLAVAVLVAVSVVLLGAVGYFEVRDSRWWRETTVGAFASPSTGSSRSEPQPGSKWRIPDLGLEFVPVPGTGVLCSIWETRVQDFGAFVDASGHDATRGMYSSHLGNYGLNGDTWKAPGYRQGPAHPVVGVNDDDAKAFCAWLTKRERAAGRLTTRQTYRLPTDAEWGAAAGTEEFPWGKQWPPSKGAGNIGDEAAAQAEMTNTSGAQVYDDGFNVTAPVGVFVPNGLGIYDLAGNVQERVGDRPGGVRGSSFCTSRREDLTSFARDNVRDRTCVVGFRVVCDLGVTAPVSPAP